MLHKMSRTYNFSSIFLAQRLKSSIIINSALNLGAYRVDELNYYEADECRSECFRTWWDSEGLQQLETGNIQDGTTIALHFIFRKNFNSSRNSKKIP